MDGIGVNFHVRARRHGVAHHPRWRCRRRPCPSRSQGLSAPASSWSRRSAGASRSSPASPVSYSSGGQLNPAVSLASPCSGKITVGEDVPLLDRPAHRRDHRCRHRLAAYKQHFDEEPRRPAKLGVFSTGPAIRQLRLERRPEVIGTFVLVFVVLASPTARPRPSSVPSPSLPRDRDRCLARWTTGYAINPARDLGPRASPTRSSRSRARVPATGPTPGSRSSARSSVVPSPPVPRPSCSPSSPDDHPSTHTERNPRRTPWPTTSSPSTRARPRRAPSSSTTPARSSRSARRSNEADLPACRLGRARPGGDLGQRPRGHRPALSRADITRHDVAAVGITNQRETVVVRDRTPARPSTNAIVWQEPARSR